MRVLLDTNVIARAAGGPPGPAHELFLRLTHQRHILLWSVRLADELSRVLRYPRVRAIHKLSDAEIDEFLSGIELVAVMIPLTSETAAVVPSDPDDDYVVQTALMGRADIICTCDRDLLQPAVVAYCVKSGVRVMNDIDLLAELRNTESKS